MTVRYFGEPDTAAWDGFCEQASNATLLHTRRFLSYHGERFHDASLLIHEADTLVGVMPAAVAPSDSTLVISHPGATYGGVVHHGQLNGNKMIEAIAEIQRFYADAGFTRLQYKPLPHIYARVPAQDDLYALFRAGAIRIRCDLSSTIDLAHRRPSSERRRRSLKKALKNVSISSAPEHMDAVWHVLAENLHRKYDTKPVHTLAELQLLATRFPDAIRIQCGLVDGQVEAGVVLFCSAMVWHAQYIASSEKGYAVSALDAVFESLVDSAQNSHIRYFDFGTSNEEAGTVLNDGLYRFKSEFGGGGTAHEFYELALPT
nr:GNAT family N-acetyltransferase [uncultured Herbaspirillum sp.]